MVEGHALVGILLSASSTRLDSESICTPGGTSGGVGTSEELLLIDKTRRRKVEFRRSKCPTLGQARSSVNLPNDKVLVCVLVGLSYTLLLLLPRRHHTVVLVILQSGPTIRS